jgi:HEAT repeat protein
MGDARAVAPLLEAMQNAAPAQQADCAGLLFTVAGKLSREQYWYAPSNYPELDGVGRAVRTDDLIRWIDDPWEAFTLRSFAIRISRYLGERSVIPFLVRVLGDPGEYTDLRVQAAGSLVQLGYGPQVLRAIIGLVPKDPTLAGALTAAVYPQNPEVGRRRLEKLMTDTDDRTRQTAFWVAAGLRDPQLTDYLQRGLGDPAPEVRMAAAWALGNLGERDSIAALRQAANHGDDQVAVFARRALQRIGGGTVRSEE